MGGLILSLAQQENSLINTCCDSSQFQHLKLRELPINCLRPLLGMDPNLKYAAEQGDIEFLYSSIRSDPKVLDNIDQIPFVDTPLHAAAAAGQTLFAMEIMTLKPSFARKLNPDGFTPMHLALQHNRSEVVLRLVNVDEDLVRLQGKCGVTPFHYAVETGNVDVMTEFLEVCPKSITDFTNKKKTALHLARNNSDAFDRLAAWVRKATFAPDRFPWLKEWLNWKDEDGKTVWEIIKPKKMVQFYYYKVMLFLWGGIAYELPDEKINILLVVGTLIITVTYEAVLSPPGGFWQENYNPGTDQFNSTSPMNSTIRELPHRAGTVVTNNVGFYTLNTLTFGFSVSAVVHLLVRFIPAQSAIAFLFPLLLSSLCFCYIWSTNIIKAERNRDVHGGASGGLLDLVARHSSITLQHVAAWSNELLWRSSGWLPPAPGTIKINVDVAMRPSFAMAACVCRDHQGQFLFAAAKKLCCEDSTMGEAEALWFGVSIADQSSWQDVIFEGDSFSGDDCCGEADIRLPVAY